MDVKGRAAGPLIATPITWCRGPQGERTWVRGLDRGKAEGEDGLYIWR